MHNAIGILLLYTYICSIVVCISLFQVSKIDHFVTCNFEYSSMLYARMLNPPGFLIGGLKPSTTNVPFLLLGFHWVFVEYWVFIRGLLGFTSQVVCVAEVLTVLQFAAVQPNLHIQHGRLQMCAQCNVLVALLLCVIRVFNRISISFSMLISIILRIIQTIKRYN